MLRSKTYNQQFQRTVLALRARPAAELRRLGGGSSDVPTLEDVYLKFGFASEAAQLLETELGNILLMSGAVDADLIENPDPAKASDLMAFINHQTLGQLLNSLNRPGEPIEHLRDLLGRALKERNRLSHSFYREHNFRRNSEEGRAAMLEDLESIHETILEAYKAVMRLSGIDLEAVTLDKLPTKHLPI